MHELNPNHQVTQTIREHWHTIAALLMHKTGATHVVVTQGDIASFPSDQCVVLQELHDGLHLRLVSMAEGQALARQHGVLPA